MTGFPWARAQVAALSAMAEFEPAPRCPDCNDTGVIWFDTGTPGTPLYCGGCSGYPGIRHEPACGTEPCPNGCPYVPALVREGAAEVLDA